MINEPFRAAMVAAVSAEPSVAGSRCLVAGSAEPTAGRVRLVRSGDHGADSPGGSPVAYRFVSPEYFSVLDIGVLRGRVFTQAEAGSNAAVAVVSEAMARQIWPDGDAVGQVLRLEPDPSSETRRPDEPHCRRRP